MLSTLSAAASVIPWVTVGKVAIAILEALL